MNYQLIYKEAYAGADEYGECMFQVVKSHYDKRMLAFFYQRWIDCDGFDYGFDLSF